MIAAAVLPGGLVAGALLATFASPVMKQPDSPWWDGLLESDSETASGTALAGVYPEDPNPYGGYRPDLDYSAEITDWSPHYPSWTFSGTRGAALPEYLADDPAFDPAPPPLPAPEAEHAADAAVAAARDARSAQPPPAAEAPPPEPVRKSELVAGGLY